MKLKIIITAVVILALAFTGWRIWKLTQDSSNNNDTTTEQPKLPSINGTLVNQKVAELRPIAVVIENHSDSRPQSGLSEADIVYETLAEGGITRFLALFQQGDPKEVGPVRSARPYFNFLSNMWGSPLVHAGGSKQALSELNSGIYKDLFDVNEFSYGDYFYRDTERLAPHNLYTSIGNDQRKLLQKKNQSAWTARTIFDYRTTPVEQIVPEITSVTIPFSTDSYEVKYQYNKTNNNYQRSIKNIASIDKNNEQQITPKNVLIMLADIATNPDDDLGTQTIKLNNNGPCFLFSVGKFTRCKWEYRDGKHFYMDSEGASLKLETGQTWIEIFPRNLQDKISWQ